MIRRQPRSTRTDTLFPYTTLFLSRGRGGVAAALASITAPVVVGGVDSDRLYPLRLQEEIADGISTCSGLEILKSKDGHDGFLTEADAVRSEERRAGKECVSTCRSRWWSHP